MTQQYVSDNVSDRVRQQIMDRIHCYFYHSYDIGNRLKSQEKLTVNCINNESIDPDESKDINNKSWNGIQNILNNKRNKIKNVATLIHNRMNIKYNPFSDLLHVTDSNGSDNGKTSKSNKMYNFGFKFDYGYRLEDGLTRKPNYTHLREDYVSVSPKYSSLKQELITNEISLISAEQFHNEHKKAQMYFRSHYCRKAFTSRKWLDRYQDDPIQWVFSVEHILSLMIYCNYTELQCEFSKTFRENNGHKHNNFFWLGKNLKISVHKFGSQIRLDDKIQNGPLWMLYISEERKQAIAAGEVPRKISAFYHGINKRLSMPEYVGGFGYEMG
eukprot:540134_1